MVCALSIVFFMDHVDQPKYPLIRMPCVLVIWEASTVFSPALAQVVANSAPQPGTGSGYLGRCTDKLVASV
jgi:hypothetical protein